MEKWVVCPEVRPAAPHRLFCFSYAGAGIAVFRNWWLDFRNVEVCCIQLPGREQRRHEQPFACMDELIPPLVDGLRKWLNRPFVFYGHSVGGRIAFEAARALRGAGLPQPRHLFVGATPAPEIGSLWPPLHSMEDTDFLDEIQRRYGAIPAPILTDPEMLAALLPALRADVALMETYNHVSGSPLECPITAMGGVRDRVVRRAALQAWSHHTSNRFELHLLEGDHFFLQAQRHRLRALISSELAHFPDTRWRTATASG